MAESQSLHFFVSTRLLLYLKTHNIIFYLDYLFFLSFFLFFFLLNHCFQNLLQLLELSLWLNTYTLILHC